MRDELALHQRRWGKVPTHQFARPARPPSLMSATPLSDGLRLNIHNYGYRHSLPSRPPVVVAADEFGMAPFVPVPTFSAICNQCVRQRRTNEGLEDSGPGGDNFNELSLSPSAMRDALCSIVLVDWNGPVFGLEDQTAKDAKIMVAEAECRFGHRFRLNVSNFRHSIQFELALLSMRHRNPGACVMHASMALEAFMRDAALAVYRIQGLSDGQFEEAWRPVRNSSQQQMGFIRGMFASAGSAAPSIPSHVFALRNKVAHSGFLPSAKDAQKHAEAVHDTISAFVNVLRPARSEWLERSPWNSMYETLGRHLAPEEDDTPRLASAYRIPVFLDWDQHGKPEHEIDIDTWIALREEDHWRIDSEYSDELVFVVTKGERRGDSIEANLEDPENQVAWRRAMDRLVPSKDEEKKT